MPAGHNLKSFTCGGTDPSKSSRLPAARVAPLCLPRRALHSPCPLPAHTRDTTAGGGPVLTHTWLCLPSEISMWLSGLYRCPGVGEANSAGALSMTQTGPSHGLCARAVPLPWCRSALLGTSVSLCVPVWVYVGTCPQLQT